MGIPVKLEAFEGPLDLLLHLIEKNKIDIYDIPIVEITEQYMEYIRQMQEENLNIVGIMVMDINIIHISIVLFKNTDGKTLTMKSLKTT